MRYSRRMSNGYTPYHGGRRRRRLRFRPTLPAAVLGLVLLALIGVGVAALLGAFQAAPMDKIDGTPTGTAKPQSGRFAKGVTVDGVALDGLTWEEAKTKVAAAQQARVEAIGVTVTDGGSSLKFTADQVKYSFDTDDVLNKAMALTAAGALTTTLTVDATAIEQDVRHFAESLYMPAYNAMVLGYDKTKPDGQRFTFSDDRPGRQADSDVLWAAVKKAFDEGTFGTVQVDVQTMEAKATKAGLLANSKLVVSYSSVMGDHSNERVNNIRLAAEAVSSRMILPGEEFSFNDATGERTAAKGYKIAHVLNGGVEDNGLGGGVCQTSGTLFNAAARADLEIVKRFPHSIPSGYLIKGQDATVDYPRKDLVIRNNRDTPVIIVMHVDTQKPWKVTAEIYGVPFPAGQTIELLSETTKVMPKLDTYRIESSQSVDPGKTKTFKPRDGYAITVWRLYKTDGVETRREKLDSVSYQPYGTVILHNPADPPPTVPPLTESPSPTPAPTAVPSTPQPTATPAPAPTPSPTPEPTTVSADG